MTNQERTDAVLRAMGQPAAFDVEEAAIDLMTNLVHMCCEYNIDPEYIFGLACDHYDAEAANELS